MSQPDDFPLPTPPNYGGSSLVEYINDDLHGLASCFKGSAAPTYREAGVLWLYDGAEPWELRQFYSTGDTDYVVLGAYEDQAGTRVWLPYREGVELPNITAVDITTDGSNYAQIQAPSGQDLRWGAGGNDNQMRLTTGGDLALEGEVTAATFNGAFDGDGSALTSLPAGQLTGTIADARLSGDYSFGNLTLSDTLTAGGSLVVGNNIHSPDSTGHIRVRGGENQNALEGGAIYVGGPDSPIAANAIFFRVNGSARAEITADSFEYEGNPIATVSQSSSASETTFPVGHILPINADSGAPNRNASRSIYLSSSNSVEYVDSTHGSTGSGIAGTWRSNGLVVGTGDSWIARRAS